MKNILGALPLLFLYSCTDHGSTVSPVRKDIIETVYASGKIVPENEYTVFALSNGTVKEKLVREGDVVVKNQTLYVISNEAPLARLDAARSNLENAQSNVSDRSGILNDLKLGMQTAETKFRNDSMNYFRMKNLWGENATSRMSVDNALTAYTISLNNKKSAEERYYSALGELNVALHNAKSQVISVKADLNNYFIKSETGGTVFQTLKETGEAVRMNEPVALLGETLNRIIRLSVDQQDIEKIKTGQEILLKADVTGNTIYHATVSRIYPVMNELDQTFRVDATFNDSTPRRYIHSSVEANIIIQQKKNALIIPRNALVADDSVQVKESGKTKTIHVQTGIHTLDDVEIVNGLSESSRVVIRQQN